MSIIFAVSSLRGHYLNNMHTNSKYKQGNSRTAERTLAVQSTASKFNISESGVRKICRGKRGVRNPEYALKIIKHFNAKYQKLLDEKINSKQVTDSLTA